MNIYFHAVLLGMLLLIHSCTGQNPAGIKNSTRSNEAVKATCSNITVDGNSLTHKNILNVFDCSGWSEKYPKLESALREVSPQSLDNVLNVFNGPLLSSKTNQKKFFDRISIAEDRGQMKSLATMMEKSLGKSNLLSQLKKFFSTKNLTSTEKSVVMNMISSDNDVNLRNLKSIRSITQAFENNKSKIKEVLSEDKDEDFNRRIITLVDELTSKMDNKNWSQISRVMFEESFSPLRKWTSNGLNGDYSLLMRVLERKEFQKDINFLTGSLAAPIVCENSAYRKDFIVDINKDLTLKIESLKFDTKEKFEKNLLHGLSAYLSFQEFCGEEKKTQDLKSFFRVMGYVFEILPSDHDYEFFSDIHKIFGEDRFVFLKFLGSKTFAELRDILITLNKNDLDGELIKNSYIFFSDIPDEEIKNIASWIKEISTGKGQTYEWYKAWSKLWHSLSYEEKVEVINLLSVFFDDEIEASKVLDLAIDIFENFPEMTSSLFRALPEKSYQDDLAVIASIIENNEVKEELSRFFSTQGVFEIIKLITQDRGYEIVASSTQTTLHERANSYVMAPLHEVKKTLAGQCYESLSDQYKSAPSYYGLVNKMSDACQRVLPEVGYVGQIYVWMFKLQKTFAEKYGANDFHGEAGLWAPEMLHSIFGAGIRAELALLSSDGKRGINANLEDIHKTVTAPYLLEGLHITSQIYVNVSNLVPFEKRFQNFLESKSDEDISILVGSFFDLLESKPKRLNFPVKRTKCNEITSDHGVNPCFDVTHLKKKIADIVRILKRKNVNDQSLIQELIKWMHPEGGIDLPLGKPTKVSYKTSLDEIITFLYDLSAENTSIPFNYIGLNGQKSTNGTIIDRLEVVIREIAFQNNFYGSFFKNEVSRADNYQQHVLNSRKLLDFVSFATKIPGLPGVVGLDPDAKWKIKSIQNTYSSLAELANTFPQRDGKQRSYGLFIQSLLASIVISSEPSTQTFSAYRLPDERLAEGHNGLFLAKIVDLSGLRHMAAFVRQRLGNLSVLDTPEFKNINSNLVGRLKLKFLQKNVQKMLDLYFDNDRKQLNLMLDDLLQYMSTLSIEEQKAWEEVVVKGLLLLSDKNISNENIESLINNAEVVIKMWPEIREILKSVDNPINLLKNINNGLDSILANPKSLDKILGTMISSKIMTTVEVEKLLKNASIRTEIMNLVVHLTTREMVETKVNWLPALRTMFADRNIRWSPIVKWLNVAMDQKPENKLTVSLLMDYLGGKENGEYRFKMAMDEALINHRQQFEYFIGNVFPLLQFKN